MWIYLALGAIALADPPMESAGDMTDATPPVEATEASPEVEEPEGSPPYGIRRVAPKYPRKALRAQQEAPCKVRFFIDTNGVAHEFEFVDCPAVFHKSTKRALRQWRWEPAQVGGEPVRAEFVLTVGYRLKVKDDR